MILAVWSLAVGLAIAAGDAGIPRLRTRCLRTRSTAVAGLAGAVLAVVWTGGRTSPPRWPWLVAAALVVLVADRPEPTHPMGRFVPALAVVSLVGVWASVPDTEPPLAAAAVLAPLALVRVVLGPRTGVAGTATLVAAVLGPVWVGSAGWGAARATACAVGAVAVAPAVMGFGLELRGRAALVVAAAHVAVALAVPRLLMWRSVAVAAAGAVLALAGVAGVVAVVAAADRRPQRPSPDYT